jgi:major membrane immunogen (membrane-anchored lipoprotein)
MKLIALLIASLALLVACGEKKADQTVFDPQIQALKKARETQATVDAGADKTRQAVEAQEEKQIQGY